VFCVGWLIFLIVGQFHDLSVTQGGQFGYSDWLDLGQEVEMLSWTDRLREALFIAPWLFIKAEKAC